MMDAADRRSLAKLGIRAILFAIGATATVLWAAAMIVVFRGITGF